MVRTRDKYIPIYFRFIGKGYTIAGLKNDDASQAGGDKGAVRDGTRAIRSRGKANIRWNIRCTNIANINISGSTERVKMARFRAKRTAAPASQVRC